MEKKRKLPPRAAARVEQAAKRRSLANREASTTASPAPPQPVPEPSPPPPSLPTSIQVGKPLPTVQDAQPEDLSVKEYQSISDSGVLAESLSRSRAKWVSDGLFEKYWTKPYKRKGILHEDANNPSKDTMTKVGPVTINIEPHIFEATMYTVKAPKPNLPPASTLSTQQPKLSPQPRPILQYGPPNGSMPPPPTPTSTAANTAGPPSPAPNPSQPSPSPAPRPPRASPSVELTKTQSPAPTTVSAASVSPKAAPRPPSHQSPAPQTVAAQAPSNRPPSNPAPAQPSAPSADSAARPSSSTLSSTAAVSTAGTKPPATTAGGAPASAAPKPPTHDPVIALLAQRASGDPELRDLMKRVAVGQARNGELAQFQRIIDQLNAEYKQSGDQPGPTPDKISVDGRTVQYYADEVRTILNIVLASNPQQRSNDLRPPPGSNPLVVLLVKTALEDTKTRDTIRRIAEKRPGFTDAQDLKDTLDRLHRDAKIVPKNPTPSSRATQSPSTSQGKQPVPNGLPNGQAKGLSVQHQTPQALRSKGPPPAPRPDISAVVFDFGNGDRFLFPKYSILEFLPMPTGQQVIASFLIVRKGSTSEYGGDPSLDYYQPITIRLQVASGRHLDNLSRVVAPQDEVQRYMNDIMDNMTRAEYVLLAMRLPRTDQSGEHDVAGTADDHGKKSLTPRSDADADAARNLPSKPSVLWTSAPTNLSMSLKDAVKYQDPAEQSQAKYERLIRAVTERETESAA